ncbi:unnamed protein product [Amoebophrya sp. A120]|nr:unnamed protein product [Amoebophrya sp. A120]|eukprot:GSA120T00017926001.1
MSLKFKGDPSLKKEKKKKKRERKDESEDDNEEPERVDGSGRIVAQSDTIQGLNTFFLTELEAGDEIRVQHPNTGVDEVRTITRVLSNRSAMIVAPFSSNFSTTASFEIFKKGRILRKKLQKGEDEYEDDAALDKAMQEKVEKALKKQKCTIQVREKVYGAAGVAYRTVKKDMGKEMTAEEALNERVKVHGRDKYCY